MSCSDIWANGPASVGPVPHWLADPNRLTNSVWKGSAFCTAEPKPDEAMADAPKLRKANGGRKKKQSIGAVTGAHNAAGKSGAADAEAMQQ